MGIDMPDALVILGLLSTIVVGVLKLNGKREKVDEVSGVNKVYCDLMHKTLDERMKNFETALDKMEGNINNKLGEVISAVRELK